MVEKPFTEKVAEINKRLDDFGDEAITSEEKKNKDGKVIKTFTGYKVQYVVDAVNEIIGPENWRWEHEPIESERNPSGQSSKANIAITLYIRVEGEWITKGPVTGDSLNPVEADAMKGALSDGLKKSFAYWSIGNKAYRGELGNSKQVTHKPPPAEPADAPSDLFTTYVDQIGEAKTAGELRIVRAKFKGDVDAKRLTYQDSLDLEARCNEKAKSLK